jgi:uncharacterized protein with GYD domain
MPTYLISGSYTAQGAKGVAAEGGSARVEAVRKLAASLGGSVESFYFAFGSDDFFVTMDMPDNASVTAASLLVGQSGAANVRCTVLLTADEVDRAAKLGGTYRAPGG